MTLTSQPEWFQYLGSPSSSSDVSWCFSDDKKLHSSPLITRKPITILPGFGEGDRGVVSFDPAFLEFLRVLVEGLNERLPVDLDDRGYVGPTGIHTSFDRTKTVAGYSMSQMSLAPKNNDAFVEELGLPTDFRSERHVKIFDAFMDRVFSSYRLSSIKTAKLSTSGSPIWLSNARMKREHAVFLLSNSERLRHLWNTKNLLGLAAEAKIVFMMNAGRRDQVDMIGKERLVFPLEYALSGGRKGEPVAANKHVKLPDGSEWDDFSATRARLFHGAPYATNLIPQVIATGTLHALFERYPETFHCTDVAALADGIGIDEEIVCSDATEYDRSMATFLLKRMFHCAKKYWSEEWIEWAEYLAFCPYFSRPVSLNEHTPEGKPVLMGNPLEWGHAVYRGNPSGHAWTSLTAKVMMVFDFLATADDVMGDVLERMDEYLKHKRPLKTHNNGDDGMYRGEKSLIRRYTAYRFNKESNPGYFKLEPEVGHVWSGYLMAPKPEGGYRAYHRIHTTVEKMFCPERSAGSNFRRQFTIGMLQRLQGGDHPMHDVVVELIARSWRDKLKSTHGDLMEMIMRHHRLIQFDTNALSAADRAVLDDIGKLYSQYSEDDISPNVLAMLFEKALTIPEVEPFINEHFKGSVIGVKE